MNPLQEEAFTVAIQSIFSGYAEGAYLHLSNADKEVTNPFFQQLENTISKLFTFGRTTWTLHCISEMFSPFHPPFSDNIYFNEMYSFKIKALEEFVQIANNKYSTKNQILSNSSSIIENFSYVRNEYQTFYHILYDYIKDTLYTIGFETVFKLKGEKSNLLFEDLNTNTLRTVSFSITDPDSVVFLPQNVEITQALQNNFIQIYLYPNKLPKMPFAATCSLTNTSIISSFPPIDVIFQIARENLVSQDLNSFRQLFDLIPTLYVPVLLANYSVISEKFGKLFKFIYRAK